MSLSIVNHKNRNSREYKGLDHTYLDIRPPIELPLVAKTMITTWPQFVRSASLLLERPTVKLS